MTARFLVVSADDFGLTPGVCRGILDAADGGVVTSTSVLAVAPAFEAWAPRLRDSGLGVGLHLALVGEDPPLLSAREVPSLVDRRGAFPRSWRELVARLVAGRIDPDDVRLEARAQLDAVRRAGLAVTHVDAHQHVHVWPSLVPLVVEVAAAAGVAAVRRPLRGDRRVAGRALDRLSRGAAVRFAAAGLAMPDTALGMDRSGRLDRSAVVHLVDSLAGRRDIRSAELAAHPGLAEDPDRARYRWGFRWPEELEALRSPEVAAAVDRSGWRLGTFADVAGLPR